MNQLVIASTMSSGLLLHSSLTHCLRAVGDNYVIYYRKGSTMKKAKKQTTVRKNKLTSNDGRLVLNTKWNSEWQEWVTTHCFDGKYESHLKNHNDELLDALDTMAATMEGYERRSRQVWDGNRTELHCQDSYTNKSESHVLCIRDIHIASIHMGTPEIVVSYKWYNLDPTENDKANGMESGTGTCSLGSILRMLND